MKFLEIRKRLKNFAETPQKKKIGKGEEKVNRRQEGWWGVYRREKTEEREYEAKEKEKGKGKRKK